MTKKTVYFEVWSPAGFRASLEASGLSYERLSVGLEDLGFRRSAGNIRLWAQEAPSRKAVPADEGLRAAIARVLGCELEALLMIVQEEVEE